jgi:hypothetical protein
VPVSELRRRIDSAEFAEWLAFLSMEPDAWTRADWLAAKIIQHVERLEATMGGKPLWLKGKPIEWDRDEVKDESAVGEYLEALINGNATARH